MENIDSADWSPDASKLAYVPSRNCMWLILMGTGNTQIAPRGSCGVAGGRTLFLTVRVN